MLSREDYVGGGAPGHMAFKDQRDTLYDLFEVYTKYKRQAGHHDLADRTHKLIRALRENGLTGKRVDYLCVLASVERGRNLTVLD